MFLNDLNTFWASLQNLGNAKWASKSISENQGNRSRAFLPNSQFFQVQREDRPDLMFSFRFSSLLQEAIAIAEHSLQSICGLPSNGLNIQISLIYEHFPNIDRSEVLLI